MKLPQVDSLIAASQCINALCAIHVIHVLVVLYLYHYEVFTNVI